ncbi:MAG: TIGR01777 family oxidoreductase [Hyphomicrobiaceae bacterium]|nr:TIGR01777 family oxidoreductase [Hyphomicrobiaceae bacterium]
MNDPVLWTLIAIQVSMGAFDTLYHHEGTERLAWRPSQRNELRLHGVRNLFYAALFICFGWFEPRGLFTFVLATILILEILITLWDFVEEDLTRKLPASERINHTLLALNYGAIIAFASPYLYTWSQMETGIVATSYGWWSVFATLSAVGVFVFGVRDLVAAVRCDRLVQPDAAELVSGLDGRKHVLITGGTGFIGTRLVEALVAGGHHVTVLTRKKSHAEGLACPIRVVTDFAQIHNDERYDVVINLAGEPIADGLWTKRKRHKIIGSRVDMTKQVVALIARLDRKPECLISGSAIGWYGMHTDEKLTEESGAKDCFVHQVCAKWETEAARATHHRTRVVTLRLGLVLGAEAGILARLLTPFEFGLGGPLGSGNQWMSWIALDDVVRLVAFVMANDEIYGPVNATAPHPVRNKEFTATLGRSLYRPALFRVPAALLTLLLGDLARETMLSSQRVLPEKLTKAGFRFRYPKIEQTLRVITGTMHTSGGTNTAPSTRLAKKSAFASS